MVEVVVTQDIDASADEAWRLIGGFNGLPGWLEVVASSEAEGEGVGAMRTLTLGDGAVIRERQEARDDESRTYTYSIVEGPLPIRDYLATLSVRERGAGACTVEWSSTFEPDGVPEADAVDLIEGLYRGGLASAKAKLGG